MLLLLLKHTQWEKCIGLVLVAFLIGCTSTTHCFCWSVGRSVGNANVWRSTQRTVWAYLAFFIPCYVFARIKLPSNDTNYCLRWGDVLYSNASAFFNVSERKFSYRCCEIALALRRHHTIPLCNLIYRCCGIAFASRCDPTVLFLTVFSFTGVAELLLRCGATVDSLDLLKMTPLHWAAENGHFAVCRLLLNKGADPLAESKVTQTDI